MTTKTHTITITEQARADFARVQDLLIECEAASESPDWSVVERSIEAIQEGMRVLRWSPATGRPAELGAGSSRQLVVPFGGTGFLVLFDVIADRVVVGAVRHLREDDYRR